MNPDNLQDAVRLNSELHEIDIKIERCKSADCVRIVSRSGIVQSNIHFHRDDEDVPDAELLARDCISKAIDLLDAKRTEIISQIEAIQ